MALADTARLIASLELQDKFTGPAKRAEGAVTGLEGKVSRLGNVGATAGRGLGTLAGNLTKIAAIGIGAGLAVGTTALVVAVKAASDLNEEIDKSAVVFGKSADEVQRFAKNSAGIGLSSAEALGAAGNFGNMFNTIGLAQKESAKMSTTLVGLASDMASFNNEDPSEMLDKLRSGLAGESEPLKRFGVLLSEAEVKAFAMREGIAKAGETLTEAQKVQARYGLILEQTAIQQGNYADTSESMANQQRTLRANITNTAAAFGTSLLPAISRTLQKVNELFIDKQPQIEQFGRRFGKAVNNLVSNENLDTAFAKVSKVVDKLAAFNPNKFNFDIDVDKGGKTTTLFASIGGIAEHVKGLPWESIGNAARLLGTGSKALLDAFLGLPPWVQTAVLTGWGLNKLTGGALGGIAGSLTGALASVLGRKLGLGITAATVHVTAGTVTGGGGGVPAAGTAAAGRGLGGAVRAAVTNFAALAAIPLTVVAVAETVKFVEDTADQARDLNTKIDHLDKTTLSGLNESIEKVDAGIQANNAFGIGDLLPGINEIDRTIEARLQEEKRELIRNRMDVARNIVRGTDATTRSVDKVNSSVALERSAMQAIAAADASRINALRDSHRAANAHLAAIERKPTSFRATVNVTNNVGVEFSATAAAIQIRRVTQSTGNSQDFEQLL